MFRFAWCSLIIITVILSSCGKAMPELHGVDLEAWKNDKNGCNGKRTAMIPFITEQQDKLLSLTELEIVQLLGKPDQNELYKRNQKFYSYFLEPSKRCNPSDEVHRRLVIRFNAVGLAKEINIEE